MHHFRQALSASLNQYKNIRKLPLNHPQHTDDTQTTISPDLPKHQMIQNSQRMGRNSPVEAEIHHSWGGQIIITKTTEMNSKTAPEPFASSE